MLPGADDDAFIIQYAYDNDGYIVSNDNYRFGHLGCVFLCFLEVASV